MDIDVSHEVNNYCHRMCTIHKECCFHLPDCLLQPLLSTVKCVVSVQEWSLEKEIADVHDCLLGDDDDDDVLY